MIEPRREAAYAVIRDRMHPFIEPDARFDLDLSWFIPGFAEAGLAAERLLEHDLYRCASTLFVTPDNGLAAFREAALRDRRTLVLPTYGLRRGFVMVKGHAIAPELARYASWLDGLTTFGEPVSLDELRTTCRFDLVVTAASAISVTGQRFGMGSNYLDLEYPILSAVGAVTPATPIVALVHDLQYWPEPLPQCSTDIRADLIVTPTATISVGHNAPRSTAVDWSLVDRKLEIEPYFAALAHSST